MAPDPKAQEWLERQTAAGALDITQLEPVKARKEDARITELFLGTPEPVDKIENHRIREGLDEIPVRVYWPKITEDDEELYPIIVFFHGGGWVCGNLEIYDEMCSMLANRSESIVISVDYRLAPEHKFPVPLHDCYAATKWAFENAKFLEGDEDTIVVAGDSAGGNLAAAVALMAKEKNGPRMSCAAADLSCNRSCQRSFKVLHGQVRSVQGGNGMVWSPLRKKCVRNAESASFSILWRPSRSTSCDRCHR